MPRRDKWKALALVLIAFWLAYWLSRTRYAMLDDALIHLRYAANLHQLHIFSYEGLRPNFGASSLAYVGLLSLLRSFTASPLLAKITSVIVYLALVLMIAAFVMRLRGSFLIRWLAWGMVLCLLSPMGIRWLTDGMETGLVILAVLIMAWLIDREAHNPDLTLGRTLTVMSAGFMLVLLRIESLSLIALASAMIFLGKQAGDAEGGTRVSLFSSVLKTLPLPVGSLMAALLVRFYFGSLLPDTAIAKTGVASLAIAAAGLQVIASSFLLGIGTLLLWLLSAALLWRSCRLTAVAGGVNITSWMNLLANAYFPLVLALACIRGQRIEGVRHILWTIEFSFAWNILQLIRWDRSHEAVTLIPERQARKAVYAISVFLALLLPADWLIAQRVMNQRALTFLKMQDEDLREFQGKVVIAGDIGFIGYFTGGQVCDLNGLVNGRAAAEATRDQRYQSCAQQHPAMLFLSKGQMERLGRYLDLRGWTPCQTYDFANVRALDRHYLIVPGADSPVECPLFGGPISATL